MTIAPEKYSRAFWQTLRAERVKQQRRRGPEKHPRLSAGTPKSKENQSKLIHQKEWKLALNQCYPSMDKGYLAVLVQYVSEIKENAIA